ncbi:efflux RND transporter periplasmic adaptor subunit [Pseudomaricurvus sp. HS19]|uniref:efflux RND transporter periplasmic adaptor subunit n=1 Tax=Pseudomaricurvus sp. HS19 TaxID=2692626 RepID=UPI00136A23EA|nr:efflux RND transporter periplasmic adaptor subunit [Pseudomaricurvus sp. HS19]MYM61960.1 efflux RND transporter periplasmic adaptor subunit [Pseudomaricurvus sp. HS19]
MWQSLWQWLWQVRRILPALVLLGLANITHASVEVQNEYDCLIDPAQVLEIGSPVMGILEKVLVSRGDTVTAGQQLAQLESTIEEASLNITRVMADSDAAIKAREAKLDYARKQRDRAVELQGRGAISSQSFDELGADYTIALQELQLARFEQQRLLLERKRAEAVLAQRHIKSPISGVVQKVDRGPGEYVFQEASIMTVVQLDPLYIETFVPVSSYRDIAPGMEGEVMLSQPQEQSVTARVIVIDRVFDTSSDTIGVRLQLDNPGGVIPAGQRCKVRF